MSLKDRAEATAKNIEGKVQETVDNDGTELYDSHTPDSYDPHIIPAETAARKKREGDHFKHLAQHPAGFNCTDTTGGFTVDKEGLMDNFAIEPEMYYETRGDLREKVRQQTRAAEHISEIRQDEIRQDEIRQEAIRQEGIRQEGTHFSRWKSFLEAL